MKILTKMGLCNDNNELSAVLFRFLLFSCLPHVISLLSVNRITLVVLRNLSCRLKSHEALSWCFQLRTAVCFNFQLPQSLFLFCVSGCTHVFKFV